MRMCVMCWGWEISLMERMLGQCKNSKHLKLWWNVTKYNYSSAVLKCKYEVLVLYLSIILCNIIFLGHYIAEANIVLFTPLHFSDSVNY